MRSRATALVVLLGVLGVAGVARADSYSDENRGFSLNVPKTWRAIPIANEEDWIVAKWLSDREYADPKEGSTHTPDLKVIIFPHDLKRSVEVDKLDDGFSFMRVKNPYKNYKEYVKSDGQGGRYVSKEEDIVVNGMKTTWYEVKFEKLTAARRAIAFMYHTDDVDYVAQYEALECQWDKLSPAYIASLKSFKTFPPKKALKARHHGREHRPQGHVEDDAGGEGEGADGALRAERRKGHGAADRGLVGQALEELRRHHPRRRQVHVEGPGAGGGRARVVRPEPRLHRGRRRRAGSSSASASTRRSSGRSPTSATAAAAGAGARRP